MLYKPYLLIKQVLSQILSPNRTLIKNVLEINKTTILKNLTLILFPLIRLYVEICCHQKFLNGSQAQRIH